MFKLKDMCKDFIMNIKNSILLITGISGAGKSSALNILEDLLDLKGTKKNTGKTVNKDRKKGKSTLINVLGYNKTLEFAFNRKRLIINRLKKYGKKTDSIISTLDFILERTY